MSSLLARPFRSKSTGEETPDRRNPFPGAREFSDTEGELFRGRSSESVELLSLIRSQRFCLLYAQSGSGKSSLINAGVLQPLQLAAQGHETPPPPGTFDVVGVAKVHPSAVRAGTEWPGPSEVSNVYVTAALNSLEPDQAHGHTTLLSYLKDRDVIEDEFGDPLSRLLVLDQFEEILEPFARKDWIDCRTDFFEQLDEALAGDRSLHVLIAIREDHLATIERLAARMTTPLRARYRLDRLDKSRAREAIVEPAAKSGLPFDDDVATKLVKELAERRIPERDPIPLEFVEPGQLQVVCKRLWDKADAEHNENTKIEQTHLDSIGGVVGALKNYYLDAVHGVTGTWWRRRRLFNFFQDHLITAHGTRQLAPADPEASSVEHVPTTTLERLEKDYGLVRKEVRGGTVYWELSHDGFVEPIQDVASERRRKRNSRLLAAPYFAIFPALGLLAVIDPGNKDDRDQVNRLEQFPVVVDPSGDGAYLPIDIGERASGTDFVLELVHPETSSVRFELRSDDAVVEPEEQQGGLLRYTIDETSDYSVRVLDRLVPEPAAVGLNVRVGARIVELPSLLGVNAAEAAFEIGSADSVLTTVRSACFNDDSVPIGTVIQVTDLDKAVVPGISGVLNRVGEASRVTFVATGTNIGIETFNGEPCRSEFPNVYDVSTELGLVELQFQGFTNIRTASVCSSSVGLGNIREVVLDNAVADVSDETSFVNAGGVAIQRIESDTPLLVKISNGEPC